MFQRHRVLTVCAAGLGAAATLVAAAPAAADHTTTAAGPPATAVVNELFPTEIALPDGFQPEGIAIGVLPFAFFGSRANGDLYRVNLATGKGTVFSPGPGTGSLGMKVDLLGRLFVAGGPGGDARVVNAVTGTVLASYTFAAAPTFVNDVILTPDAAWFTDSLQPVLYKVPLGRFGRLPDPSAVVQIPLSGAYIAPVRFQREWHRPDARRRRAAHRAVEHGPAVPGGPRHRRHDGRGSRRTTPQQR